MTFPLSPGVYVREIDLSQSVQGQSTSQGAIAGIYAWGPVNEPVLISSQAEYTQLFGKPSNLNAETWFSGWNFLSYTNALWVTRAANTTANTSSGAYNAVANSGPVANVINNVVLSQLDFASNIFTDPNVLYVAKYPGALGNTLRIAQCDSVAAFSSVVTLTDTLGNNAINGIISAASGSGGALASGTGNSYTGVFSIGIGSNTGTILFTAASGSNIALGNTYATIMMQSFSVGDNIIIGSTALGSSYTYPIKITSISNAITNSTATSVSVRFSNPSRLPYDFTTQNVIRKWEFYNQVNAAPGKTPSVQKLSSNRLLVDQLSIVVIDQNGLFSGVPGTILETFNNLSYATDAINTDGSTAYYKNVINSQSKYLWSIYDRPGITSDLSMNLVRSTNLNPLTVTMIQGQDGDSETAAPLATLATAWQKYDNPIYPISYLIQGKATGGSGVFNGQSFANFQLTNWLVQNVVAPRGKDCIVFASPDKATVVNNIGFEAVSLAGWTSFLNASTYLFVDSGYKWQYDQFNNIYRFIPLCGDCAGTRAYTDGVTYPWFSNAGINRGLINNVIKLAYNPNETDRDFIYPLGINPVITESGYGTYLDGDRMFTVVDTAFNRINVRNLFIYCEKAIKKATKVILFDINDVFTQNQFKNMVNPFLAGVVGARGITDFVVICDGTNNTPQVVDGNQFIAGIYIKPARVIDFIRLDFIAVSDSVSFAEVENPAY